MTSLALTPTMSSYVLGIFAQRLYEVYDIYYCYSSQGPHCHSHLTDRD